MSPTNGLRLVDADGHVLEHPTEMPAYAPKAYRDRIWHIETDKDGNEWVVSDGRRGPANGLASAGTAGMNLEDRERAFRGELRYTEVRPAAYNAKARLEDMDTERILVSVLYPTFLLGIQGNPDAEFADVQCRAYNDWLSDHVQESQGRLYGVAIVPQQDLDRAAAEIRRAAKLPGMVGVLLRPNPTADWKPFNDPIYDPLWRAASETGLAVGLHPFLDSALPGACQGFRLNELAGGILSSDEQVEGGFRNVFFTQAISNPFDMMNTMSFLLAGGVCERYPELRLAFLEANGGWVVPWLERLDHHFEIFPWDVPGLRLKPSEYFKRQCWISFDPDETTLAFTANSPLVGADRIIWASDYPQHAAKFPGTTDELLEAIQELKPDQQERIAGLNANELYRIS